MKKHLSILLILACGFLYSQEADSTRTLLERSVENAVNDSLRIDALLALGEYEIEYNLAKAEGILNDVLIELLEKEEANDIQLATAYIQNGIVERRKGNHTKTLDYYLKALDIFEMANDSLRISDTYHNLGMVYRSRGEFGKGIAYFKKAIAAKEVIKDTHGLGAGYNMMGVIYRKRENFDSAIDSYKRAKQIFQSIPSSEDIQRVNNNMVVLYLKLEEYEKALPLGLENIEDSRRKGKEYSLCTAYYNVSRIYIRMERYDLAMEAIDSSLVLAKKNGFRESIANAYLRKSFINNKQGNFKKAYDNYRTFNRHSDSIFNIENVKKAQELELKYQFEREKYADSLKFAQENKETQLRAENEAKQKMLYLILLLGTLVAGGYILYLVRKNQKNRAMLAEETLQREKAEKELLDQRLQVNLEETKRLIADNSMRLSFKQELLNSLKNELDSKDPEQLKSSLKSLTLGLQTQIATENKLSGIQTRIDEVNKGFDAKLRELFPDLTKTEREICTLLRLNLSVKEIMTIRNASLDSVKSARYRIRKKMAIPTGTELERFIQDIA
ncbi:tetratricopeptide repeat protein [Aureisphaera galaxeae]|uniref:tetratricopeptide repeat protein n=1 Tax=Aureisphaera galaxeae TaxID=1538023 RepID=UPI00235035C3|nr:tetratricopeptide repeat protein [Aureisphaera galaxeae]MDC8004564.1 tetratricopeptide repeat protein [Aureisphaera galaxeae]